MTDIDVLVIGAGPGGLAAAAAAAKEGARTLLIERDINQGGILNQCIHDGFGLVRYKKQLTGPEYADLSGAEAAEAGVKSCFETLVTDVSKEEDGTFRVHFVTSMGAGSFASKAVVLATGCRERTRGMIGIPGSRPAGVYTAGAVQNLVNVRNVMAGKRIVILGTGDIGLIMARRLTLEGAKIVCAIEINDDVCGLSRNVRQCLQDFDIPVYLSHTVTKIIGKNRVEAVMMCPVDKDGVPDRSREKRIECDTLILSVGLIPENEVAQTAHVSLDPATNGVVTDENLMTSVPGIFACGNCKSVMDLADYVSAEGETAGKNAAAYALGKTQEPSLVRGVNTAPKGVPQDGSITCIFCPKGCTLTVSDDGVTGNGCEKGLEFAEAERTDPLRILTTTVRVKGEKGLLPVRSDGYVYLRQMRQLVRQLNEVEAIAPVEPGEVIAGPLGDTKVNIIAQCEFELVFGNLYDTKSKKGGINV